MKKLEPNEHLIIVTDEELLAIEQVLSPAEAPVVEAFEGVPATAPAESGSYTATHYVDIYTNVSGSPSNDEDAQNATAYSNATSSSTPCTLACALANATAGDVVQVAPGAYIIADTADGSAPALTLANSGSAGNPITFFAQYPAAYNTGSPSLLSEIRRPVSISTDNNRPVVFSIGVYNDSFTYNDETTVTNQYIIFDGFYIDESVTRSGPSRGVININNTNHVYLRRWYFDRRGVTNYPSGGQGHCVWGQNVANAIITDCYCLGDFTENSHTIFELYNAKNCTVEHNTTYGLYGLMYWKTEAPSGSGGNMQSQGNVERYNYLDGNYNGLWAQSFRGVDFHNNVVIHRSSYSLVPQCGAQWQENVEGGEGVDSTYKFYSNTFYLYLNGAAGAAAGFYCRANTYSSGGEFKDNIVYIAGGAGTARFLYWENTTESSLSNIFATYNNNVYYAEPGASIRWQSDTDTFTTLANWQTEAATFGNDGTGSAYEANSIYSDPEFVDAANGDFTLAANSQAALTASTSSGECGAYATVEEIGQRASPTY